MASSNGPKLSKYIADSEIEINRQELKNAPYNPRKISDRARKKLMENIKKVKLMGGLVWNRRSGNLVSGHQRIGILDSLEKTPDYIIRVTPVDLDEKTEKEQNVFFNNREAQGDFDLAGLEKMMADSGLDIENMGFDLGKKFEMFGFDSMDTEEAVRMASELRKSRDLFDKTKKKNNDRDADDFYCVVVFKDNEGRRELARRLGVDDHRYFDGRILLDFLNVAPMEPEAD